VCIAFRAAAETLAAMEHGVRSFWILRQLLFIQRVSSNVDAFQKFHFKAAVNAQSA
jgi:hypothetical protein